MDSFKEKTLAVKTTLSVIKAFARLRKEHMPEEGYSPENDHYFSVGQIQDKIGVKDQKRKVQEVLDIMYHAGECTKYVRDGVTLGYWYIWF